MPYSSESPEWRLLHEVAKLLTPHLTRYQPSSRNWKSSTNNKQGEALERNLREAFLVRDQKIYFEKENFELLRTDLDQLCCLLNEAVNPLIIKVSGTNTAYPYLSGLLIFLKQLEIVDSGLFNLVSGPNQNLFKFTDEMETKCLTVTREFNALVTRALSRAHKTEPDVPRRTNGDFWKDLRLRKLASETFQLVFERFSCKANHRLLLGLAALAPGQSSCPRLELFLSVCSDKAVPELSKVVYCTSGGRKDSHKEIIDLCYEMTSANRQNYMLRLLPQKEQLLSARYPISSQDFNNHPILKNLTGQSLAERVTGGMFKRQTVRNLIAQQQGVEHAKVHYTLKAKRALAAELGYCLLDFFDASLDAKDICFFGHSDHYSATDRFYRSFSSQIPSSPDFRYFRIGHPVLLSFAKILLELDDGEAIPLDIRPCYGKENDQAWLQLLSSLSVLQEGGTRLEDSYMEAIRGCLNVHSQLQHVKADDPQADKFIRDKLYHHIVQHLETALENCSTNLGVKRQHSMNPEVDSSMELMNKRICTMENNAGFGNVPDRPGEPSEASRDLSQGQVGLSKDFLVNPKAFADTEAECSKGEAQPPKDRSGFKIAIICALPLEFDAIQSLFALAGQKRYPRYGKLKGDDNQYVNGRIGGLDVVVLLLSGTGKVNAATAATSLKHSYTELEVVFLAGVCGGIPGFQSANGGQREILLGDVIVSSNMVQYDFGRRYQDNFVTKQPLHIARKSINNFLVHFKTDASLNDLGRVSAEALEQIQKSDPRYQYPGSATDRLYAQTYQHQIDTLILCTCFTSPSVICKRCRGISCDEAGCDEKFLIPRCRLKEKMFLEEQGSICEAQKPLIFLGRYGSGDTVLKSSQDRDGLAEQFGIEAFEMESAGLWEDLPCIVVKGVCDYADSHKNKRWQDFAAATSASVVKALLERYIISDK